MNTLNRRDYTDTPDHDDACMVCDKIDCICPPEPPFQLQLTCPDTVSSRFDQSVTSLPKSFEDWLKQNNDTIEIGDERLDAEIERQRALGYETFDDYINRTGFPRDEASYAAFIGEGRWMLTSRDKPI